MDVEVLIAGAGPAGATAAAALAASGHEVLLVDRADFPRPKICGDGIPVAVLPLLAESGAAEEIMAAGFYRINAMCLESPGGFMLEYKREGGGLVARREEFDSILQRSALRAGAVFMRGSVRAIEEIPGRGNRVTVIAEGREMRINARMLIGADGTNSRLGRRLNPGRRDPAYKCLAVRGYFENFAVRPHCVEFYSCKPFRAGYAWIFPVAEDCANIGVGILETQREKRAGFLPQMLADFLGRPQIRERRKSNAPGRETASWPLPLAGDRHVRRLGDNALVVGDAAQLVNPLDGGGIFHAVLSARIAARVTSSALRAGDCSAGNLKEYDYWCRKLILRPAGRRLLVRRVLQRFPPAINFAARLSARQPGLFSALADADDRKVSRFMEECAVAKKR